MNFIPVLAAALVPTAIGFIWYNPKVLGNTWMKAADMTEEKIKGANMAVIIGASFLLSVMLAFFTTTLVIHQSHISSALMNQPGFGQKGSEVMLYIADFMERYGQEFRTFKHGALHGFLSGLFFSLPVIGMNAMFERKGYMYIAINVGYWCVTLALMGGIISQWA
jgi:hypothetical protein